jgi:flagellin
MVINTNISALTSASNLNESTNMLNKALAQLSSGSKIVSPADDPAGLAESIGLQASVNRTSAAISNIGNAVSFSQTQDGYLQQIGGALDRMSQLSINAQDVTKSSSDLADYQAEFATLQAYVTSASGQAFNGVSLFSTTPLAVTTDGDGGTFSMAAINLNSTAYTDATAGSVNISTSTAAMAALALVKTAITQLATDRANIGANESRLTYTNDQLGVLSNNLSAAKSQITDVDVAAESTQYAKYQILVQAGTSMLAQANQNPGSVLKLLQ